MEAHKHCDYNVPRRATEWMCRHIHVLSLKGIFRDQLTIILEGKILIPNITYVDPSF
jgi:hypothetical protein